VQAHPEIRIVEKGSTTLDFVGNSRRGAAWLVAKYKRGRECVATLKNAAKDQGFAQYDACRSRIRCSRGRDEGDREMLQRAKMTLKDIDLSGSQRRPSISPASPPVCFCVHAASSSIPRKSTSTVALSRWPSTRSHGALLLGIAIDELGTAENLQTALVTL